MATEPRGVAAPRRWPLAWALLPSLLLAAGALLLALHERERLASYRQSVFRLLFARNEPAGATLLLILLLAAAATSPLLPAWLRALPARLGRRRELAVVAAVATLLLAAGTILVYQARPLAMDEFAPWFQARVFAAGRLAGRFPPDLLPRLLPSGLLFPFFATSPTSGAVVSTYWPGFALLLTPFTWLGVPWLLNPLLGGGSLLLLAALARRWTGDAAAAGWAVLLALASPAFTVNALSFYPLTAHLALNLLWMALLVEGTAGVDAGPRLTSTRRRLLAAGAVGSLALVLHNPVPHAIFATPWIAALLRRRGARATAWLALGYLPLSLLLGAGWLPLRQALDGTAPVSARSGSSTSPGLAAARDASAAALPTAPVAAADGVERDGLLAQAVALATDAFALPDRALLYARLLALAELVTWAAPLLPALALFGWSSAGRGSPLRLLAGSALATLLLYCFVPFDQGHGWGYRYFHAAWAALPLLGAAALVDARATRWRGPVLAAALLALPAGNALRAAQVHSFVAAHRAQLPPLPDAGRHLCFVSLDGGSYRVDLLQNDPFLRDPIVVLASDGFASDAALVARRHPGATLVARRANGSVWRLPP